jgi:hypothetical protein
MAAIGIGIETRHGIGLDGRCQKWHLLPDPRSRFDRPSFNAFREWYHRAGPVDMFRNTPIFMLKQPAFYNNNVGIASLDDVCMKDPATTDVAEIAALSPITVILADETRY